jgi:hypothetical protein
LVGVPSQIGWSETTKPLTYQRFSVFVVEAAFFLYQSASRMARSSAMPYLGKLLSEIARQSLAVVRRYWTTWDLCAASRSRHRSMMCVFGAAQ